jgi:GTP pyrophosphokinase
MSEKTTIRPLSPKFTEAFAYAAEKHATQIRKGTTIPYISHPMGVASLVLDHGGGEVEAIAALLHDVAEDCGGRPELERIRARFGDDVARIVEECTDSFDDPKPPWRERKERYLAHLATASSQVRLVSVADKLHNARAILADIRKVGGEIWKRFPGRGADDIIWYYRSLVSAFQRHGATPLVQELEGTVSEMERLVEGAE